MSIILAKLVLSLVCVLVVGVTIRQRSKLIEFFQEKSAKQLLPAGWVLFRLIPFVVIYLLGGFEPTSDVNGFWDEGSKASQGQVVYQDFWSPYSPLYAYVLGLGLKFWYDAKMIVLTMLLMDGLALGLTYLFYQQKFSRGELLFKALVYFLLPGSLVLSVVAAQEDVWMWLFVVLAWLLRKRSGVIAYSLILALGVLCTKAIFCLALVPLFFIEKKKIQFLWPIALIGVVSLAVLYPLVGMKFTQPLDEASVLRAPNILSVLTPWTFNSIGTGAKFWNWIGLAVTVGSGTFTAWKLRHKDFPVLLSHVWVVMYGLMMIVQQSAYSNYIFLFLLPLVFWIIDWTNRRQIITLLLFNVVTVVHPSMWWRFGMPKYLSPAEIFSSNEHVLDYVTQLSIVLLTLYFVWIAFPKSEKVAVSRVNEVV